MATENRFVEEEAEWEFPKLCFRMSNAREYTWYIVDDTKTVRKKRGLLQILKRSLPPTPKPCFHSACTSVDNPIFVLGGTKAVYPELHTPVKLADVYYIHVDTDDRSVGDADDGDSKIGCKKGKEWRKGRPVHRAREASYALNFNGKLLVMSGMFEFKSRNERLVESFAEMWDADKECWEKLCATVPPRFSTVIDGHAVLDNGHILFHGRHRPTLFCYDIDAGSVQIYREDFGRHECSAFVDGILYTLTHCPAGLIGFDAYNPESPIYSVSLSNPRPDDGQDYDWLPVKDRLMSASPSLTMVALGNHCLAVLWLETIDNGVDIYCSRWKMKKKKKKGGRLKLAGRPISFTTYRIYEYVYLESCLVLGPTVATNEHAQKLESKPSSREDTSLEGTTAVSKENNEVAEETQAAE